MADKIKLKTSKKQNLEDKVVPLSPSTPSTLGRKSSRKPETPSPSPYYANSHSPGEDEEDKENGDEEDGDDDLEEDDKDEEINGPHLAWSKNDDLELLKFIRNACPENDNMKFHTRVDRLNWESIKFQDYSAEQCKSRWLHIQNCLRHYRILAELLEDAASWVDSPRYNFNKGKKINPKHPELPKKPTTSFMLFYMEQKDAVLEKQPGLGMSELRKIISKMYHELSDDKKTKYWEMAGKLQEAYKEEMKKFKDAHPDYFLSISKQTAKAELPKPPKHPFRLFSEEKMEKLLAEGMTSNEARREACKNAYKELKDEQKIKWIYQALEQENEYNKELEKFKNEHPDIDVPAKKFYLELSKDELRINIHKNEGKPEKPPNSGYSLFSKKLLSSNSLKQFETNEERMAEISRLWKELSNEEKASYNDEAAQGIRSYYKEKYASYLETLTPEQRNAEFVSSVGKNVKRTAGEKADEQPMGKKPKISAPVDVVSSLEMESDEDLARKNKVFVNTAQNSKNELSVASKKSLTSNISDVKNSKKRVISKKLSAAATASKSPERDSSPKQFAANSDSKSLESPSKFKPSLNTNAKSSTEKISSCTPKSTIPAANQLLFMTEAMNEPPKPPKSAAAYYVLKHYPGTTNLSPVHINVLWLSVSEVEKKQCIEEFQIKQESYLAEFEKFLRSLKTDELKAFRAFIENRDHVQEDDRPNHISEEDSEPKSSNEHRISGACSEDSKDEPHISSDED